VKNSLKLPVEQLARLPLAFGTQVAKAQNGDGFDMKPIQQAISDNVGASAPPTAAAAIALLGNYDIFSKREIYPNKFTPINAKDERFPSTTRRAHLLAAILGYLPLGEGVESPARADVALKKLLPSNTYLEGMINAPLEAILSKMSDDNIEKLNTTLQERSKEMMMNNSLVKSWFVQSRVKPNIPEAVTKKNETIQIPESYHRSTLDESNPLRPLQKKIQDMTGGSEIDYTRREFSDKVLQGEKDYNSIVAQAEYEFNTQVMPIVSELATRKRRGPTALEIESSPKYQEYMARMTERAADLPQGAQERIFSYIQKKLMKADAGRGLGDQTPDVTTEYQEAQTEGKQRMMRAGLRPGKAPSFIRRP
jgi:hypothetical protein